MHHFEYRDDNLFCEGVSLEEIARKVGTPTYVYSLATLQRHYRVFDEAFAGAKHLICFSVKANGNLAVLRSLAKLGAGFDIVSGGELYRVLAVGADAKKVVFSGVGKRPDEIEYALRQGILLFNVESHEELCAIDAIAGRVGLRAPVSLRVNPDVDAETHPYISTGLKKNKFGIPFSSAQKEYEFAAGLGHIDLRGIDCHIGSQLTKVAPFRDAISRVADLASSLARSGVKLTHLDVGGGLGIPYKEDEDPPAPKEYARAILSAVDPFRSMDLTLLCEPGRVIVGNAGVLLTEVLYRKQGESKHFVIVDAAFNDLVRPALYDGYHGIKPLKKRKGERIVADVVGPICETGDFFARDRELEPAPEQGDLLALMSAGAYGFSMASNYNARPRAAEVLVSGSRYAVVRKREVLEDLVAGESIPEFV